MQWLVEYNAALASICFMTLLGFIDDVLDVPWRVWVFLVSVLLKRSLIRSSWLLLCSLRAANYCFRQLLPFHCWWHTLDIQLSLYQSLLFHILGSRFWTWVCFLIPIVWDHCSHTHTCYFARIHPHHEHQSNFKNILLIS